MKKTIIATILLLVIAVGIAAADKQPGAVMASDASGDDVNIYPGTMIYIKGHHLVPNAPFSWEIYDMESGCVKPINGIGCGTLVYSGSGGTTDGDGYIWPPYFTGWNIPDGDRAGHNYKLIVTFGGDEGNERPFAQFYTKVDTLTPVPELGTIALVSIGVLGLLFVARKYRK